MLPAITNPSTAAPRPWARRICRATGLLVLLGLSIFSGQAQQLNTTKLDSLLASLATHNKMMGSLAISRADRVVYSRAFGYQDVAAGTLATAATRYRVGSATKMFTAVMIFQLIEEKKLLLTTPLATFFPRFPNAQAITIDQLLSHRSGLYNFTNDTAWVSGHMAAQTPAQMLERISRGKPEFAPGTQADYTNSGYVLLGYIVEQLTKRTYAQALQKRVLAKIGLVDTYQGGKIDPQKQEAFSYVISPGGWQRTTETDMSIPGGAGFIGSTPTDLNRFLTALFAGRLVSAASLKSMETIRDGYGRGLFARPFGARAGYGHTGGLDSFVTLATYFPAEKLAVTFCSNGQNYSPHDVFSGALSICFGEPYKVPAFLASGYVPTPADLVRYVGTYASPQIPGLKISMTQSGATLQSQATGQPPATLDALSAGVFKFDQAGSDIRIEFDAAKPSFLLKQGGETYTFNKE
ncbi:serine hydrolase domain-containing protein [Hymenobacter sp. IS2118]|uniref:serine hydrolase domain-containing protein n=1 Tax=Hymenobacter sp. IS2118 TaxID=1505605 RepID=UPI00068CB1E7|nr:serine hydrolase domain-containing protein [Hymenobacter sp. IS2118]